MLVLDDIDDRTLLVLRVSPVTLPRYLAYRGGLVTVLAAVSLLVSVPLSGLSGWLMRPLPATWVVELLWRYDAVSLLAGVLLTVGAVALLARRTVRRLS